jgi:hypothetical protein
MADLRTLAHYQRGNVVAFMLQGERPNVAELMIERALKDCCALLVIGANQDWRREDWYELVTAVDRSAIPKHLRDSAEFVFAYDRKTGQPLNGGKHRMAEARAALVRDGFDIPDEFDAELAQ